MTYVLGITDFHDTSATLLQDGKIIAAAEEERFVRVKHAHGFFPYNAIKFCLSKANIKPSDIDYVGYFLNPIKFLPSIVPNLTIFGSFKNWLKDTYSILPIKQRFLLRLRKTGIKPKKIFYVEHHMCHAASTAMLSGFKKSMVLTLDGRGEHITTGAWLYNNGDFELLFNKKFPDSIGYLYQFVTEYLGFKPNDAEWKVMGLAPYGTPKFNLSKLIKIKKNGDFKLNRRYFPYFGCYKVSQFAKDVRVPQRVPESNLTEFHKNMAASIQKVTEDLAIKLLEHLISVSGTKNLCIAGGVGLNCKMNKKLRETGLIDHIFIQPAANDSGTSLGAALWVCRELGIKTQDKMEHVYYGKGYSNKQIEKILKVCNLKYEPYDDIAGVAAKLVSRGKIIGWFQGRFEFGPRALGNRSIIADPRFAKIKDRVNAVVKYREPWRPFAPSILAEDMDKYLEDPYPSPFMILTFNAKRKDEIPAVVHIDSTTRPQTVERKTNPIYHKLISDFKKITGVPVIFNTSFNVRGQPIVNTPHEALQTFFTTGMDALVLGNYLIKK